MFDAQTSAFAAQKVSGSIRASRVVRDALVAKAEVRREGASNGTRGRVRSPFPCRIPSFRQRICVPVICELNLVLKIKNSTLKISQKIGKVMQGHASVFDPPPPGGASFIP